MAPSSKKDDDPGQSRWWLLFGATCLRGLIEIIRLILNWPHH
jgi:hypothetical protein